MQNEGIGPFTGAFSHAIIDGMVDDGSVLAVMRQVWGWNGIMACLRMMA